MDRRAFVTIVVGSILAATIGTDAQQSGRRIALAMRCSITPTNMGIAPEIVKQTMNEYTSIAQWMERMSDEEPVPEKVANEYRQWARENGLI